jgi:thiopeptide-type bacteriocin biosynthesis protein
VVLVESEQRLPLDLDHPVHLAVLRARLDRVREVHLQEAPSRAELGWIGRAHEILIALHRTVTPPASGNAGDRRPRRPGSALEELPGRSTRLVAVIYGHPDRQNEILSEHLPRLLDGWTQPPVWWFDRHRQMAHPDRHQHLTLTLRLDDPDQYGPAAAKVGDWAAQLHTASVIARLQLDTYQPHVGRFGAGSALAAAEDVFAADAAAALTALHLATTAGLPVPAVCAAGLVDLATAYAATDGLCWLTDQLPHQHTKLDRQLRDHALTLTDPADDWATLRRQPTGEQTFAAWQRRRTALTTYRHLIAELDDPDGLMRTLLHQHHVRTAGVDPDGERLTHRLARTAALRLLTHPGSRT